MNIIFDHQAFSRQDYGGIARYFFELFNLFDRDGHHVEIRAPLYVTKYFVNAKNKPKGRLIPKLPNTVVILSKINSLLTKFLWSQNNPVDIYHETYFTKADNCPKSAVRIITVYDMIHEKFPEMFSRLDQTSKNKSFALHRADHIISISHNTKKDLIKYFDIEADKISVVHLGHLQRNVSNSHNPFSQKPYLLYVGGRWEYKNFTALLEAYADSENLKKEFRLVCFGGGAFNKKEQQLIAQLHLDKSNIIQKSGEDLLLTNLYKNAAAFVYPSLYEGFGLPPLEAMSLGCPVICSNVSSLPEVIGNAAEQFDPQNIDSLRTAIESVVFNTDHRENLISQGYAQSKLFSWEKCASETLEVYKKVIAHE